MLHRITQAIRAWHRGDVRVAPGTRGRIYGKPGDSGSNIVASTKGRITMKLRVWRATTKQWEEI